MNTTYQEFAGTETQSDPDSSPVPIGWAGIVGRPALGEDVVDKQGGIFRPYTARSGDASQASARFHRYGRVSSVVKERGAAMGRALHRTFSGM